MRLWSLHPRHLDTWGLVALWREGLLARKVLQGRTKGYRSHPQLARFRAARDPLAAIDAYLEAVLAEATARGYRFDAGKIGRGGPEREERRRPQLVVTRGQLAYEREHLLRKLEQRDPERAGALRSLAAPSPHPLFRIVEGGIADWERPPRAAKGPSA
jgi:hypothetical protein